MQYNFQKYSFLFSLIVGPDDFSVLDNDFRVKSVAGLRVADASAMPDLISGNTNAPTIMLAELCANEIKATE